MLHGAASKRKRRAEVFVGDLGPSAAQFQFSERGWIEGIRCEPIKTADGADFFEAAFGTTLLSDGNGTIEGDNWRGTDGQQRVIKRNDALPVGFFGRSCLGVDRSYRCFDVILGQLGSGGRKIEQALAFGEKLLIPA
jgi:hypothetical protein